MIRTYIEGISEVLASIPHTDVENVVQMLRRVRDEGATVFVFGNGGSATTASHLACDLVKGTVKEGEKRLRVMTLCDMGTLTAYGNDCGYERVFAEPLRSLGHPGDLAIAISGSGNSPNVLEAVAAARQGGIVTVGLAGFRGGKLAGCVDRSIVVPSTDMQYIEDAHLVICHAMFRALVS